MQDAHDARPEARIPPPLERAELDLATRAELTGLCRRRGLQTGGTKADLIDRLIAPPPPPAADETLAGERRRRLELAALNRMLARKRCIHCGTTGAWTVYGREGTTGRVRYVRCRGCQAPDQVAVIIEEIDHEPS